MYVNLKKNVYMHKKGKKCIQPTLQFQFRGMIQNKTQIKERKKRQDDRETRGE